MVYPGRANPGGTVSKINISQPHNLPVDEARAKLAAF